VQEAVVSALEVHNELIELKAERALALTEGLGRVRGYMADLESDIELLERAYVGAAVTEIASLRAELFGPQVG
jgi:hypothetical protein